MEQYDSGFGPSREAARTTVGSIGCAIGQSFAPGIAFRFYAPAAYGLPADLR